MTLGFSSLSYHVDQVTFHNLNICYIHIFYPEKSI